jgi:hypothetical protein
MYIRINTELEVREPTEQAQAEEPTNPELSQCKPWLGFENSCRAKKLEVAIPSNFKEFGKKSPKFGQNPLGERKEHGFFEKLKFGHIH